VLHNARHEREHGNQARPLIMSEGGVQAANQLMYYCTYTYMLSTLSSAESLVLGHISTAASVAAHLQLRFVTYMAMAQ
jgi:hypothetical protein